MTKRDLPRYDDLPLATEGGRSSWGQFGYLVIPLACSISSLRIASLGARVLCGGAHVFLWTRRSTPFLPLCSPDAGYRATRSCELQLGIRRRL